MLERHVSFARIFAIRQTAESVIVMRALGEMSARQVIKNPGLLHKLARRQ